MKGMVISSIFIHFLNNMRISVHLGLKFGIPYFHNVIYIIPLFILLSD